MKTNRLLRILWPCLSLTLAPLAMIPAAGCGSDEEMQPQMPLDLDALKAGLTGANRQDYKGDGDGGLAHISYWTIKAMTPEYAALPATEQAKLAKIQGSVLHSTKLPPKALIAGTEITGTLTTHDDRGHREQEVVLKLPQNWNGSLVVAGTPGTRSEFSNEAILVPWLLQRGYAYVSGNKGMTNGGADGNATLLGKAHITQHWGVMMLDLAAWASQRLQAASGKAPLHTYAVGLSNGGYQVRRALEIDHERVAKGQPRLFSGGLDWAGVYWPDRCVLDQDHDGQVSPAEYAGATQLVSSNERAAAAMGYLYDAGTLSNPTSFGDSPPFSAAQAKMQAAGFTVESAILWGAYNQLFDALKAAAPIWKGVGYYNLTAYFYRADLLGDDAASSAAYQMWGSSGAGHPAFYDYIASAANGGWTADSVGWALRNATSGAFSVPMISLHGDRDALIGLTGNGVAYDNAVKAAGTAALHRLYVIQNGNHVDAHADGTLDYNCNGTPADEGAADLMTPMQPYVERAFDYLVDWVDHNREPGASKTIPTNAQQDVLDASQISF